MNDLELVRKVKNSASLDSPEFTGVPKTPTPSGSVTNQIVNVEYLNKRITESGAGGGSGTSVDLSAYAKLASPEFTGVPKTPTPSGSVSNQIVNVEYLNKRITESGAGGGSGTSVDLSAYAKLASPQFSGVPTTPIPDGQNQLQITNVKFVSGQVDTLTEVFTNKMTELQKKIDSIQSVGVDVEKLKQEIIKELKPNVSDEVIKQLESESVKISFSDLDSNQNNILKQIEAVIKIISDAMAAASSTGSFANTLYSYYSELNSKKNQLIKYYNAAKAAYDVCCENNTSSTYADFTQKLKIWDEYAGEVLGYCQSVLSKFNGLLVGLKADATQQAIFNLLTNNGEVQGIYYADVKDDTGKTTRQLFINGEYAQLRGACVKDTAEQDTFRVTKSGNVIINATEFSLKGKSINSLVGDAISSDTTIKDTVDKATSGMKTTLDKLTQDVNTLDGKIGNVSETVKDAIADDIITEAEEKALGKLFNDISSRQTAVLKEIDAVLTILNADINKGSDKVSTSIENRDTLYTYRNSVKNAFTSVEDTYKRIQSSTSNSDKVNYFKQFDTNVTTLNTYVGTARSYCQTAMNNLMNGITSKKLSADREAVFNALTDNGTIQGITMVEDADTGKSQLYINGEYIRAEDFKAGSSVATPDLYVERINCVRVPTMLEEDTTVYVNPSSSYANDDNEFEEGAIFKTFQGAVDACPVILNGNSAYIRLQSNITEDILIRGINGGTLYIYLENHNLRGNIKIWDCHSIMMYGGTTYNEDFSSSNRPVITPYKMVPIDTYYYTIFAVRTNFVYVKNINVYGKVASSDSVYTNDDKNFALGAGRGSILNAANVGVINSDNGLHATRGGKIISQNCEGYCTKYGYYNLYGGQIDICSGTFNSRYVYNAVGGKVANYKAKDKDIINVATNMTFSTSAISTNSSLKGNSSITNSTSYSLKSNTGYSYRIAGPYKGSWSTENVVREGTWSGSTNKGFWFFGSLLKNFKGYNVTKIVVTVTRQSAGSYGSSVTMHLRYHNFATKTAAGNAVSSTSVGPAVSDWSLSCTCKAVGSGSVNTFTLTSSNASAALSAIKSGSLSGFALYSSGASYQQYSPTMKVTVYCD